MFVSHSPTNAVSVGSARNSPSSRACFRRRELESTFRAILNPRRRHANHVVCGRKISWFASAERDSDDEKGLSRTPQIIGFAWVLAIDVLADQ